MSLLLLDTVGSTQDELLSLARQGRSWTAVGAGTQTAGRGRFGRAWESPPGESLSLSVLLPMPQDAGSAPFVGMALALRVAEFYDLRVQWPNDVTFQGRKIAGILIEGMEIRGQRWLIAGIGVNLGQMGFPHSIADRATSLRLELEREFDWREEARVITDLAQRPMPGSFQEIADDWNRRDETPGKRYRSPRGEVGIAERVDGEGRLRLVGVEEAFSVAEAYFGIEGG